MTISRPKVAVLLPTYMGGDFLATQLDTILRASSVDVHIFAHDDGSTDDSIAILKSYGEQVTIIDGEPTGGAAQNVFFLFKHANWDKFEYVALADQDDIWLPEKLCRGILAMKQKNTSAYSSSVTAFWMNGRTKYIEKSNPQQKLDYLFESGGPGNTHIYTVEAAMLFTQFLRESDAALLDRVQLHDWLIYAFFRSSHIPWFIDDFPSLLYRQHANNVMGASSGVSKIKERIKLALSDWYIEQMYLISQLLKEDNPFLEGLSRSRLQGILVLLSNFQAFRRKRLEGVALLCLLMFKLILPSKFINQIYK